MNTQEEDLFCLIGMIEARLKKIYLKQLDQYFKDLIEPLSNDEERRIKDCLIILDKHKGKISQEMVKYWDIIEKV